MRKRAQKENMENRVWKTKKCVEKSAVLFVDIFDDIVYKILEV